MACLWLHISPHVGRFRCFGPSFFGVLRVMQVAAFYVPDFVASWAQGPSHAWVHNFPGSMPPSRCVRRRTAVNRLVFSRVRCETLLPRRDSLWLLSSIRRYTVDSKWVVNPTSRGGDFIKREDSSQTSQSKAAIGTIGPLYHR